MVISTAQSITSCCCNLLSRQVILARERARQSITHDEPGEAWDNRPLADAADAKRWLAKSRASILLLYDGVAAIWRCLGNFLETTSRPVWRVTARRGSPG